jgi:hypothetical protein
MEDSPSQFRIGLRRFATPDLGEGFSYRTFVEGLLFLAVCGIGFAERGRPRNLPILVD